MLLNLTLQCLWYFQIQLPKKSSSQKKFSFSTLLTNCTGVPKLLKKQQQKSFKKNLYTLTWFHAYGFSYQVGSIMSRGFDLQIKLKLHQYSLKKYTYIWLIIKTKDFFIDDTTRYLQGVCAKGNLKFPC